MSEDLKRKTLLQNFSAAGKMLDRVAILDDDDIEETDTFDSNLEDFASRRRKSNNINLERETSELPSWSDYFDKNEMVSFAERKFTFNIYFRCPQGNDRPSIPIFFAHHGAGSSGLTFAPLVKSLEAELGRNFGFLSFDARGHGRSKPLDTSSPSYDLSEFVDDFVCMIEWINKTYLNELNDTTLCFILLGHSLGGSVCTNVYPNLPNSIKKQVTGLVMLDIVEEMAKFVLTRVDNFLAVTPNIFSSVTEAIEWYQSHNYSKVRESAEISVPSLFHNTKSGKLIRITNLASFKPFWGTWFEDLSSKFVSLPTSKLLILAGNDNLDKELIVGQMQGKYQLIVFQDSGHFIQEDVPKKAAITLIDFWRRSDNRNVVIKTNWGNTQKKTEY